MRIIYQIIGLAYVLALSLMTLQFGAYSPPSFKVANKGEGLSHQETDKEEFGNFIKKSSGANWTLWDQMSVLHSDLGVCNWKEFKPPNRLDGTVAPPRHMCLYPRNEDLYVSGQIEDVGYWQDCGELTGPLKGIKNAVYMDIGTNIGACVMQVLATTDAKIIAFEPSPRNLFRLTSTLMNLPYEMKQRVTLFPVGLSDATAVATIRTAPHNAGNTQVIRSEGAVAETGTIAIEKLDDLLSPTLRIDLVKLVPYATSFFPMSFCYGDHSQLSFLVLYIGWTCRDMNVLSLLE